MVHNYGGFHLNKIQSIPKTAILSITHPCLQVACDLRRGKSQTTFPKTGHLFIKGSTKFWKQLTAEWGATYNQLS